MLREEHDETTTHRLRVIGVDQTSDESDVIAGDGIPTPSAVVEDCSRTGIGKL